MRLFECLRAVVIGAVGITYDLAFLLLGVWLAASWCGGGRGGALGYYITIVKVILDV